MLFNLLLATKTILLCFFFFSLIVFKRFLAITLLIENTRLRLLLVIPTGPPITVANEAIETTSCIAHETNKVLSK